MKKMNDYLSTYFDARLVALLMGCCYIAFYAIVLFAITSCNKPENVEPYKSDMDLTVDFKTDIAALIDVTVCETDQKGELILHVPPVYSKQDTYIPDSNGHVIIHISNTCRYVRVYTKFITEGRWGERKATFYVLLIKSDNRTLPLLKRSSGCKITEYYTSDFLRLYDQGQRIIE